MAATDPPRSREVVNPTRRVLEAEIARLASLIPAGGYDLIGFDRHVDGGSPYIEIGDDGELHWIVKERGQELDHRTTRDPDELLYWSFQITTFTVASNWELRHLEHSQDFRIRLWTKQAELLYQLNPAWAHRWRRELAARQPGDIALMPKVPPG